MCPILLLKIRVILIRIIKEICRIEKVLLFLHEICHTYTPLLLFTIIMNILLYISPRNQFSMILIYNVNLINIFSMNSSSRKYYILKCLILPIISSSKIYFLLTSFLHCGRCNLCQQVIIPFTVQSLILAFISSSFMPCSKHSNWSE